jgi:hypothetical protein
MNHLLSSLPYFHSSVSFFSSKTRKRIRKSTCIDGVIDTVHIDHDDTGGKFAGGKFAAGVNYASGELPLVSTTPAVNLLPESTTPWDTNDTQNAYTLN